MTQPKQYQVEDKELLVKVYKKLWVPLVPKIPASVAPNTVTVLGQVASILGLVSAVAATMGYPVLYIVSALLWLAYLTADNIDGMHARRTGQTSALGEFLDHGLDGVANGSLLLTACVILGMNGIWMALFLTLGAMAFMVTFWEQYRTGKLVLPEISAAEGVTLVAAVEIMLGIFAEPPWLRFDIAAMNGATYIILFVLCCYAIALIAPVWRVHRETKRTHELLPALAVVASACGYVAAGAAGPMPAVMVAMLGADVVCRMILLRHEGKDRAMIAPYHYLVLIPLVPAAAGVWAPDAWAGIAMGLSIAFYARTLIKAGMHFGDVGDTAES